ncbi:MAG: class I SAM-dependent methyltransferase [Dongiaceae bacterium]
MGSRRVLVLTDPVAFIREQTALATPVLVPEIRLHLATEVTPLWRASETLLATRNVPPPYWAFAWPGGQALARYLLDRPETVRGRRVLDFAAGSGLVGIAAVHAQAAAVAAADIDAHAAAAIKLNAAANSAAVDIITDDLIGRPSAWDVVLAGDVCYEQPMAGRTTAWLRTLAAAGTEVLLGDPGRTYRPADGLMELARYQVPTSLELETRTLCDTAVWRLLPQ